MKLHSGAVIDAKILTLLLRVVVELPVKEFIQGGTTTIPVSAVKHCSVPVLKCKVAGEITGPKYLSTYVSR